jgi:sterol desaturase/sphingolipid hydroxylase (fatty acid hydroxylase superfamily)
MDIAAVLVPGWMMMAAALCVPLGIGIVLITAGRRRSPRVLVRALLPRRIIASPSGRGDIAWFLFSLLASGGAIGWALLSSEAIGRAVSDWLGPPPAMLLPAWAASLILTLAIWLAYEFAYWLDHWMSHRVPLLWEFHKIHHSAESLSLLTNFRVHPVETIKFYNLVAVMTGASGAIVGHMLGKDVQMFTIGSRNMLIFMTTIAVTYLQHSHIWVGFGPKVGRWLLGPAHHQVHHSRHLEHYDRNFGAVLAVWDRLFGTFHMPARRREVREFGVDGLRYNPHGFVQAVVGPFWDVAVRLRGVRL